MARITVFVLLAWLPLLVLSAFDGHLLGGCLPVPFLADVDVHIRFLTAMPLLVGAEGSGANAHSWRNVERYRPTNSNGCEFADSH
jgi:hypothetical protein